MLSLLAILASFSLPPQEEAPPSELQSRINLAEDGATIRLEGRRYETDHAILIEGRRGLTVIGQEGTEVVCLSDWEDVFQIKSSIDITIQGVTAYHKAVPEACSGGVISVEYCRDVRIENCELNGCGVCGVLAHVVRGLEIINNEIHHNSYLGLQLQRCTGVVLSDNRLHDNHKAYWADECIPIDDGTNQLEGEAWAVPGAIPHPLNTHVVRSVEELKALPDDIRSLSWRWYPEDGLDLLERFEHLEELRLHPDEKTTGRSLLALNALPSLRKLSLQVEDTLDMRSMALRLQAIHRLEELEIYDWNYGESVLDDRFLMNLLRDEEAFPNLKSLTIRDRLISLSESSLEEIKRLEGLEFLQLEGLHMPLGPKFFDALASLPSLKTLRLVASNEFGAESRACLTGWEKGMARMEGLQELTFQGFLMSGENPLSWLSSMPQLRELNLRAYPFDFLQNPPLGQEQMETLGKLEYLEVLRIGNFPHDFDFAAGLKALAKAPKLHTLGLERIPPVDGLKALSGLSALKALELQGEFSTEQTEALAAYLGKHRLTSLMIENGNNIEGLKLHKAWFLNELRLISCDISKVDWTPFAKSTRIMTMQLRSCGEKDRESWQTLLTARPNLELVF